MAKKKKSATQKAFKPEDYIRTKARQLPIYKCYKSTNPYEDREMSIVVVRQHPQGTFTLGGYMLDLWCLGVKDSFYDFSVDEERLDEILSLLKEGMPTFEEVSYVEAHNWVYGAHDFAADAGIEPCKDFAVSQYILEPDDDNVELIEYDFGRNGSGIYCLVAENMREASQYIPILDKTLGKGNYGIDVGPVIDDDTDDKDDYDWDDDDNFNWESMIPEIEYTYEGGDYPKTLTLTHQDIFPVISKDMDEINDEEINTMLKLPADSLRTDLQNIILWELGRQWGRSPNDINKEDENHWHIIPNALMMLTAVGNVDETLPVVLEVMRQPDGFADYNFGDISDVFLWPVVCKLCKDNPRLLLPYLLEPGLTERFKNTVLDLLEHIGCSCDNVREDMISMVLELLDAYKEDLHDNSICNGTVAAFAVGILMGMNAKECVPSIKQMYATGLVDESVNGDIDTVIRDFEFPWHGRKELPPMDPIGIRNSYIQFLGHRDI